MAWSYVGGAVNDANSGTVTVTHGVTINSGDLVVAYLNVNGPETITADDAGWTEAVNATPSGETAQHAMYWKTAGASEPSSYSWSLSGSNFWGALVKVYRGSAGPVVDAAAVTSATGAQSPNLVCDAIDGETISADAVSIVMGGHDNRSNTGDFNTADNSYVNAIGTSDEQITGAADRIYASGTTFSGSVTISGPSGNSSDITYSVHISFLEDAGGGSTTFNQSVAGSLTPSGALVKGVYRTLIGSLSATGRVRKKGFVVSTGSVTPSSTLDTLAVALQAVQGSITAVGTIAKKTKKLFDGSVTVTGALSRMTGKAVSGTVSAAGALYKKTLTSLTGRTTATGAIVAGFRYTLNLAGSITGTGTGTGSLVPGDAGEEGESTPFFRTKNNDGSMKTVEETRQDLLAKISNPPEGEHISDLWNAFFDEQGVPGDDLNSRMVRWLKDTKGVSGRNINTLLNRWRGKL